MWPGSQSIRLMLSHPEAQNYFEPNPVSMSHPHSLGLSPPLGQPFFVPLHKFSSWTSAAGLELGEEMDC